MKKIFCFGDSITYGESDLEHGGWAQRLKHDLMLKCEGEPVQKYSLYNLGVGGETTDGLVNRFKAEFFARKIKGFQNIVILNYGANDIVIHKNKNIVPIKYFLRNLKQCVQLAQVENSYVLIVGMAPISSETSGQLNCHGQRRYCEDIIEYNQAMERFCSEMQCEYVAIYNEFAERGGKSLLAVDGLHPNGAGHQLIYDLVSFRLNKLIE